MCLLYSFVLFSNFWAAVNAFALLSCSSVHVAALFLYWCIEQINDDDDDADDNSCHAAYWQQILHCCLTYVDVVLYSQGARSASDWQFPMSERQGGSVDLRGRTHRTDVAEQVTEASPGAGSEDHC